VIHPEIGTEKKWGFLEDILFSKNKWLAFPKWNTF
jgi:hypothetical protein